jgi:Ca2+-binding EF-hand superfamily protein
LAWTKEKILKNIETLMRSKFTEPKEAFDFYDEDKDGFLSKNDFKKLLQEADVSILIRGLVAEFMLQSFDKNGDGLVDWKEFQVAIAETNLRK